MPGMTFKSVCLALLGLTAMSVLVEVFGVFDAGSGGPIGTEAIPLDALLLFALLLLLGAPLYAATRYRLLQPAEMLCVMYVLLIGAPLISTGFWRFMIASGATIVKAEDWEHYDSTSPLLWPHGDDLLAGVIENPHGAGTALKGNVHWETLKVGPGQSHPMPVLENADVPVPAPAPVPVSKPASSRVARTATAIAAPPAATPPAAAPADSTDLTAPNTSTISFTLPVMDKDTVKLPLDEPYVLTMRARAQNLGNQARYFVTLIYDDDVADAVELFSSADQKIVTVFQPEGFNRHGLYGFPLPTKIKDHITIVVGLTGAGRLEISDLNFFNLSALQGAFTGRRLVSTAVYNQLRPAERADLVVAPSSFVSWAGLRFLITGYIPWGEWRGPIFFWGSYVVLLLGATFAISCLLRRQWVENERFSLPLTQVPITLAGLEDQLREGVSYLRNPYLWGGFVLMFFYTACNSLRFYFSGLPDLSINIPLKSYLPDPSWGHTWETSFGISGLYFALALFMDLNVLFSLLVGFFLFRFQYWFGEARGLTVDDQYPYAADQSTGALLSYGLIILFVARRFLFGTVREAWRGGKSDEVLSPRAAYLLLLFALAGSALLTYTAGMGVAGPLVLTGCILLCLLVAMKMRAESGYTSSNFLTVGNQPLLFVFGLFGSLSFFNTQTAIFFGLFTMMFLVSSTFPLLPGLQVELVALGHRLKVRRGDIIGATVLGIVGGMAVGGWAYLSGAYTVGANKFPIAGHYMALGGFTFLTDAVSTTASAVAAGPADPNAASAAGTNWFDGSHLGFLFGVAVTTAVSFLRQLYAGFWFHPFGYILGSSQMMGEAWGSILTAWTVRLGVLRLGGAASVREKLFPFAVGCVLAIVAVSFLVSLLHGYAYFFSPGGPKPSDRY